MFLPFDHFPAFITPLVRVLQQKIRGKGGHDDGAGRDLQRSVTLLFDRQVEIQCFAALLRRNRTAVCFILPVNIAVTAPFGILRTAMPGIPACVFLFTHDFIPTLIILRFPICGQFTKQKVMVLYFGVRRRIPVSRIRI